MLGSCGGRYCLLLRSIVVVILLAIQDLHVRFIVLFLLHELVVVVIFLLVPVVARLVFLLVDGLRFLDELVVFFVLLLLFLGIILLIFFFIRLVMMLREIDAPGLTVHLPDELLLSCTLGLSGVLTLIRCAVIDFLFNEIAFVDLRLLHQGVRVWCTCVSRYACSLCHLWV